jgi:branched-chain amino acid transport system substrate-binding protein
MKALFSIASRSLVLCAMLLGGAAHSLEVVVGQVAPLSGLEANQGRSYSVGMQLFFNQVNKAGGVNGHTFKLVRKDDAGDPKETVAATRKLLAESRPVVLAGFLGGAGLAEITTAGLLESEKIALVGYRAPQLRVNSPFIFSVRASLEDEIRKITGHLATVGIQRLALLVEGGLGEAEVIATMEAAVKQSGGKIIAKGSYPSGSTSVRKVVEEFTSIQPQAIVLIASGAASAAFIEQYKSGGGTAQVFAHSGADIEQLSKRLAEEHTQGIAIAQVTPNPYKISARLTKEFQDAIAKAGSLEAPVSYAMLEGYIAARVIVEAVRRMGTKPDRDQFPRVLETIDGFDMGGYLITYRPGAHVGSRFVELSIVNSTGRIRQ